MGMDNIEKKVNKVTIIETKKKLLISKAAFLKLLRAVENIPKDADIYITTPGGGDWSRSDIYLGDTVKHLVVEWLEEERTES
jgi:hypothetical protein